VSTLQVLLLVVAVGFASVVTLLVRISNHLQAIHERHKNQRVEKPE
jgi:hypothetical protein